MLQKWLQLLFIVAFIKSTTLQSVSRSSRSQGYLTVVGSNLIKTNSIYNAAITSYGLPRASRIKLSIDGYNPKTNFTFNTAKTVSIAPWTTQVVKLNIGELRSGLYTFFAQGVGGLKFNQNETLSFNTRKYSVYIQTDKLRYKPGDLLQYRVIFLDANLKDPNLEKNISIYIIDSSSNRIQQWDYDYAPDGVISSSLQLSSELNLGRWTINVEVLDEVFESKTFIIEKYVLPKFEVTVDAQNPVLYSNGKIVIVVNAKYTFGQGVRGETTVTMFGDIPNTNPALRGVSKTKIINGQGVFEFDIVNELKLISNTDRGIRLTADFKEILTGTVKKITKTIRIFKDKYAFRIISSNTFKPSLPERIIILITNSDGTPIQSQQFPLKVKVRSAPRFDLIDYEIVESSEITYSQDFSVPLEKNGIAILKFTPPANQTSLVADVTYQGVKARLSLYEERSSVVETNIKLNLITVAPVVGKPVVIEIASVRPMQYFTYLVVGRNSLILSRTVKANGAKVMRFNFAATFAMAPSIQVVGYYVDSQTGRLVIDTVSFDIPLAFQNQIKIRFSKNQTKPAEQVNLIVNTRINSRVGLLGVDQSVLLLGTGNDLNAQSILRGINNFIGQSFDEDFDFEDDRPRRTYVDDGFSEADVFVLTNGKRKTSSNFGRPGRPGVPGRPGQSGRPGAPGRPGRPGGGAGESAEPTIRRDFPETWIWEDFIATGAQTILPKKVPDTITSWIVTGFSMDPVTGIALVDAPTKLQVFMPFFVALNLPYSIIRGEAIAISVIVFNFLSSDVTASVKMDNAKGEFEFLEGGGTVSTASSSTKQVVAAANGGTSVVFIIRPKVVGYVTIKVTATSPNAGDGIERQLLVEPEGITQYVSRGVFIDLRSATQFSSLVEIDLPNVIVPDSLKIQYSAVGDILDITIRNVESLIRLPYGCGEQNIARLVPNIAILDYLTALNRVTDEVRDKSIRYMIDGYQRQMTYRHPDYSYSAFGYFGTNNGSTWLTSFVLRAFRRAQAYIFIDDVSITEGFAWLAKTQNANGEFIENGIVFNKALQSGSGSGLALTSYVLTTFLQTPADATTYSSVIQKAVSYIVSTVATTSDLYSLAISAYALQLAKDSNRNTVLQRLQAQAKTSVDTIWWEVPADGNLPPWYAQPSKNVEITAYALLAYVEAGQIVDAIKILRWLISKRSSLGGWWSTQDTVVGVNALTKIATLIAAPNTNMKVFGRHTVDDAGFTINQQNIAVLQTRDLPSTIKDVTIVANGNGVALGQVNYKFNILSTVPNPRFKLTIEVLSKSTKISTKLKVCTNYVPRGNDLKSNMAVMEVSLPSGFTADPVALQKGVNRIDYKNSDTVVILYFINLDVNQICVELSASLTFKVAERKKSSVIIYDYYDNTQSATEFYGLSLATYCDICEGQECRDACRTAG